MTQQERISETIAQMNRDREQEAASRTRSAIQTIACILGEQRRLAAELVKAREALAAITYEPVSAAEIIG